MHQRHVPYRVAFRGHLAACLCAGFALTACGGATNSGGSTTASDDVVDAGTDANASDASGTDGASTVGDTAAATDAAGDADAAATPQTLPVGEHFCLHNNTAAAVEWALGWGTSCILSVASPPPFTPALKTAADYWCTFYDEQATKPASCPPKEDMIGFCEVWPNPAAGLKAWRLIYKSKLLPDTDALSLNMAASGCLTANAPDGKPIAVRKCTGTVTAKVDGVAKDFSKELHCTYKNDGSKAAYFVEANTASTDRLQLYLLKENGVANFGTDDPQTAISKGAGYLEGGTKAFITPVDAAARTFNATVFAEKGAGLTATFSLGGYKSGSGELRTITDGSIAIQIAP